MRYLLRLVPLLLIAMAVEAGSATLRKGPYLIYPSDSTEMRVLWQADETPANSSIEWWTIPAETSSSGALTESGSGPNEHQFGYTLTDLTPESYYRYRVTVDATEETGSFLTAPPDAAVAVTIYGYGDTRSHPDIHDRVIQRLLYDVDADPVDRQTIAFHTGDLVDDGNLENDWNAHFFNRSYPNVLQFMARMPVLPCWGNHDGTGELLQTDL